MKPAAARIAAFDAAMADARSCLSRAEPAAAFALLERAHVLGQRSFGRHVCVHLRLGRQSDMTPLPRFLRHGVQALVAAGAALALAACQPAAPPPSFKSIDITGAAYARDFSLPDAGGATRALAQFRGKVVLVFFGFTQCPDVCPTSLGRALEVRQLLGADADKVQVVFVSVDPERDTAPVLREYMKAFDPSFIALRGTADQVAATAKEFKVFFQKVPSSNSYTMDHTTVTYVFDPQGRIRLAVKHEQSAQEVAADVRNLLRG
jgi:protein SCO1/2